MWFEQRDDLADGILLALDGPLGFGAQDGLELGEGLGLKSGLYGGR
ncbi:hypothetical protein OHAE_5403 [Ochrobactrum soli]|uniref:Uncharacterized protein n=1 Tax=Ochrobactrum soli TaxID=2448455 RepID=A0A2P9HE27_9HYPH|nr:hypothetical protein OHAE_5403 [[Ochrobactrum] soli]